jgi:hypothetical protein
MDTIQEIFIYLLCVLVASFILCSPILMLFGFFMMPSRIGKVLFYLSALTLLLVIAGIIKSSFMP